MAKRTPRKRMPWKEFMITSYDDLYRLDSAWQSSQCAFGDKKVFRIDTAIGMAETNLSIRDCRALFRFADVRWYDYITGLRNFPDDET